MGVKYLMLIIDCMVIIAQLYVTAASKVEEQLLEVSTHNNCLCPGDVVTYECTVVGDYGGITVWMGDFFHCLAGSQVIELVHRQHITNRPKGEAFNARTCNDGNIVGRIVRVENGRYISQLNVTLTSDIVGKSIECAYDNGTVYRIGSLNLTTEFNIPLSPKSISWMTNYPQPTLIAFIWNTYSPDCPTIHYNILASNCGSCPTTTNHTTVTCTDVPSDSSTCTFAVQTVICGNISGESSQVLSLNNNIPGSSECGPALISAICLGVALFICLIGLVIVTILVIKSKTNAGTLVVNTTLDKDATRHASESVPLSSHVNTKKNIAYVVHSPKN